MMSFLAEIFGYLLNFLYNIFNNYGIAIIVFSIILKLLLLPISMKQQKTMKKTNKIQEKLKDVQEKYKNDPNKLNEEVMNIYKEENMSPFSGCLSAIIQIVLLFSVFYLVRSPLTYMKKVDSTILADYSTKLHEETTTKSAYDEIEIIKKYGAEDEKVNLNMNFLGLDLSNVPTQNTSDYKTYIIPGLYVITTIISMVLTQGQTSQKKSKDDKKEKNSDEESVEQLNKGMMWMMPIMSISIALVTPLGLALYWLVSNILSIFERIFLDKFFSKEEGES